MTSETPSTPLRPVPPPVKTRMQFMALIGLVTTAGASLEAILTTLVARLMAPPARGKADWQALEQRRQSIARKPFAAKIELLELVWPHRWTSAQPLIAELRSCAQQRNDAAHTWDSIDYGATLRSDGLLGDIDLSDYWNRTGRGGQTKPVDLSQLAQTYKDFTLLEGRLVTMFFVDDARNVPVDIAWVLRNGPGDISRVDRPEQHEGFTGWA